MRQLRRDDGFDGGAQGRVDAAVHTVDDGVDARGVISVGRCLGERGPHPVEPLVAVMPVCVDDGEGVAADVAVPGLSLIHI